MGPITWREPRNGGLGYQPFHSYGQDEVNQGVYTTLSYIQGFNLGELGTRMSSDSVYGAEAGPMPLDRG